VAILPRSPSRDLQHFSGKFLIAPVPRTGGAVTFLGFDGQGCKSNVRECAAALGVRLQPGSTELQKAKVCLSKN
jgi:hypothetical protein